MKRKKMTGMLTNILANTLAGISVGAVLSFSAPVAAQDLPGDAAKGEKVFKKCKACHAVGDGAKNKTGPQLNGIVGAAAAAQDGFKYSKALQTAAAEGLTWTPDQLDAFLTKPKAFLKGTKMSFAGLKKETQRLNLIKFLSEHPAGGS